MKKWIYKGILKIKDSNYDKEYKTIKNIKSKDDLYKFNEYYLSNLLLHAYKHVPYYHRIFDEIKLIENGDVDLSKFNQIPILTKKDIRQNFDELLSDDYSSRKWYYNYTGGSTGEPVKFIQDSTYRKWADATNYYYYKDILGVEELHIKKVIIWGSERDLFKGGIGFKQTIANFLTNTKLLNSFKMTNQNSEKYIKLINSYKPDLIRGYAGSLYELSNYCKKKNIKIHKPKIIISAAETIEPEMREKIQDVFTCELHDFYGSRDVSGLAGECYRNNKHELAFSNYIEILNNDGMNVNEGEEGRVIVTNLHNYSMPIIRYEIGDMAIKSYSDCSCGNFLPILKKVTGRITDHFLLENGTVVPAEFFIHIIGVVGNKGLIKKFQVIQEDYKTIKILVVADKTMCDRETESIGNKIRKVMGENCVILWEYVQDIPKTPSGKYIYTKSLVWENGNC